MSVVRVNEGVGLTWHDQLRLLSVVESSELRYEHQSLNERLVATPIYVIYM